MSQRVNDPSGHLVYRTLDGEEARLPRATLEELRAVLRGALSTVDDPPYEEARHVWNAMVEHRPAFIAHCSSTDDVAAVVRFAHEHSMLLSVRGGGHHIAGNAVAEDGATIDLSRMRSVRVDPARRRAHAAGGALLVDVDRATQNFGLATPLGINSTTGLGGLALGGGFGWLTRKYGMTIDNLVSAEIVGADGQVRVVSASHEPDLFWAIRGGGGNFGVVTSFELALHPVGPAVYAGLIVYPGEAAVDVMRGWRDAMTTAPEDLSAWVVLRKAPPLPFLPAERHGKDALVIAVLYAGDAADGPRVTAPLLELGTPLGSMLGPQPYTAFQQAFDPMLTPGARNYWKTNDFAELEDEAIEVLVRGARAMPGQECEVFVASLGGAMGRVPPDATAYAGRDARFVMNVHGRWRDASGDGIVRSWARNVFDATSSFATGGGYVNFMTGDEAARVASAYGENYERLREVKRRYDPDNLFRMNHNVEPAGGRPIGGPGARRRAGAAGAR